MPNKAKFGFSRAQYVWALVQDLVPPEQLFSAVMLVEKMTLCPQGHSVVVGDDTKEMVRTKWVWETVFQKSTAMVRAALNDAATSSTMQGRLVRSTSGRDVFYEYKTTEGSVPAAEPVVVPSPAKRKVCKLPSGVFKVQVEHTAASEAGKVDGRSDAVTVVKVGGGADEPGEPLVPQSPEPATPDEAPVSQQEDYERKYHQLANEVDRLASFILNNVPGEPSRSEGAVDMTIRVMGDLLSRPAGEKAWEVFVADAVRTNEKLRAFLEENFLDEYTYGVRGLVDTAIDLLTPLAAAARSFGVPAGRLIRDLMAERETVAAEDAVAAAEALRPDVKHATAVARLETLLSLNDEGDGLMSPAAEKVLGQVLADLTV